MLCLYCTASMLPCGRYYYEPEGGYVGNPWVKFSYQYVYLYLIWILHHADLIDFYIFNYAVTLLRRCQVLISKVVKLLRRKIEMRIYWKDVELNSAELFFK
jgi:hypothetical protein